MGYISVTEAAKKWKLSERSVRNYCAHGRIEGAFLTGRTWNIPEDAPNPSSRSVEEISNPLLKTLKEEKEMKLKGGIYHKTQIELTYNSNHIEGSRLSADQTRFIFETNTIGINDEAINVDDIKLQDTVKRYNAGHITSDEAAKLLGVSKSTFYRRIKSAGKVESAK